MLEATGSHSPNKERTGLPLERLLSIQGFLNYVVRTYRWMNPYLKGLHNTIDGWREDRDEGGWKVTGKARKAWSESRVNMPCRRVHDRDAGGNGADEPSALEPTGTPQGPGFVPPRAVQPVERLYSDVKYLTELLDLSSPPQQRMRANETACFYLPGNAGGLGFDLTLIGEAGGEYDAGTWDSA